MSVPAPTALPAAARQLAAHLLASRPPAQGQMQVIGLAAPPGSGKSTVAEAMVAQARQQGLRAASLSLDDVYLPRRQRQQLAARIHPLLATRGPPGSHDLALALSVITTLRNGQACALPRFDKLADERLPPTQWLQAGAGLQLLVLEGWMLGVGPQDPAALVMPVNALEREHDADGRWRRWCNQRLQRNYPALWQCIDWLCVLQPQDWETVLGWRIEQEQRLAASQGRMGMDAAAVARFLQHFERVGRHAMATLPAIAALCLPLDAQRRVLPA